MKNLLFVSILLVSSLFSVAKAQELLRTTSLYLKDNTILKLELLVKPQIKGPMGEINTYLEVDEDACRPDPIRYYCVSELKVKVSQALSLTLKNTNGAVISQKVQDSELVGTRKVRVAQGTNCQSLIKENDQMNFVHPHEFINFDINGKELAIAVVFTGKLILDQGLYEMQIDQNSLQRLDWFFKGGRGSSQLIDPNAPTNEGPFEWDD